MAKYEMVWEVLNSCPNNQMRDVFFREVETDDPEAYVRSTVVGDDIHISREDLSGGDMVFFVESAGLHQKFTFTPDD